MPRLGTFAEVVTDLERLHAAANANAEILPGVEAFRVSIEAAIAELRGLASRRDTLNADKQVLSADLKASMQRGRDLGTQFRSFARAHVGIRSEKMVEFRVPVRRLGIPRPGATKAARAQAKAEAEARKGTAVPETGPPAGEGSANGQG